MSAKHTIRFIVNPFSGATSKAKIPALIDKYLDKNKYDYSIHNTESAGHATVLTNQAVNDKIDIVVACGGDGTVNEVAKALINKPTALGIIPAGSGNGFAMHIGLGRKAEKAIEILNTAKVKSIDSCMVNNVFFLNFIFKSTSFLYY